MDRTRGGFEGQLLTRSLDLWRNGADAGADSRRERRGAEAGADAGERRYGDTARGGRDGLHQRLQVYRGLIGAWEVYIMGSLEALFCLFQRG